MAEIKCSNCGGVPVTHRYWDKVAYAYFCANCTQDGDVPCGSDGEPPRPRIQLTRNGVTSTFDTCEVCPAYCDPDPRPTYCRLDPHFVRRHGEQRVFPGGPIPNNCPLRTLTIKVYDD